MPMSTDRTTVYPTNSCFDDALDLLTLLAKERNPIIHDPSLRVVHGLVWQAGTPSAHAWVEIGDQCIFRGILEGEARYFSADWQEYYFELVVRETTRYTLREAITHNWKHNNYGPWEERYREFCRERPLAKCAGSTQPN